MNEKIKQAIELAKQAYIEEYGEDSKMEEGEEFAVVFNDSVLIMRLEGKQLNLKFIIGEPFKIDFNMCSDEDEEEIK